MILILTSIQLFSEPITIGITDINTEVFYTKNNKFEGSIGVILQEILDETKLEYIITILPFERYLKKLESGEIDIAVMVAKTDQRDKTAYYLMSICVLDFAFITLDKEYKLGDSLENKTISTLRKSNIQEMIFKYKGSAIFTNDYSQGVLMTKSKRVYGSILPYLILNDYSEDYLKELNIVIISREEPGIYVSKKSKHYEYIVNSFASIVQNK